MRPDEHKAKESRRYQNRKKQQGDATAAEIAEKRRIAAAKARDKGTSVAAIRRRNGEIPTTQERPQTQTFSRRKITSNADRYVEITEQELTEQIERDAEMGIDRETTNLVAMLEKTDDTSGAYFKFKNEQTWETTSTIHQKADDAILKINFDAFEGALQQVGWSDLLDLPNDVELIESALQQEPIRLELPIVPAFAKDARGLIKLKPAVVVAPVKKEQDGMYVRNQYNAPAKPPIAQASQGEDDLDELLALDQTPEKQQTTTPATRIQPKGHALPKPASVKPATPKPATPKPASSSRPPLPKPSQPKPAADDDEAWLDDILG